MTTRLSSEARYGVRHAWVDLKNLLGISLKSDKAHLCDRIVRAIARGRIHRDSAFTAGVRPDGLGAVMIQRLSVQAAAEDLGFRYFHKPFEFVGHPEMELEAWTRHCEAEFELGHGLPLVEDCDLPYVEFYDFAVNEQLWGTPHLIGFREMFRYCNARPHLTDGLAWGDHYRARAARLRNEARETSRGPADGPRRVAVHVRRGDVSRSDTAHRFTPNSRILATIAEVETLLKARGIAHEIEVYSNGTPDELADFTERGYRIADAPGAIESFRGLVTADVLVMAKSAFSYVAGLSADGVVVYEPQGYARAPRWVMRSEAGSIDPRQFEAAVQRVGWTG